MLVCVCTTDTAKRVSGHKPETTIPQIFFALSVSLHINHISCDTKMSCGVILVSFSLRPNLAGVRGLTSFTLTFFAHGQSFNRACCLQCTRKCLRWGKAIKIRKIFCVSGNGTIEKRKACKDLPRPARWGVAGALSVKEGPYTNSFLIWNLLVYSAIVYYIIIGAWLLLFCYLVIQRSTCFMRWKQMFVPWSEDTGTYFTNRNVCNDFYLF